MDLIVIDGEGAEREVRIEKGRDGYLVSIDGEEHLVDHVAAGGSHRSLLIEGRQQEVAVLPEGGGSYRVTTSRGEESLEVRDPLDHLLQTVGGGAGVDGPAKVTALMPGRVVSLLAAEGDEVEAGQGILVLEAMKMENEIAADHSGTLKRFFVEPGQAVESGDDLFEIGS